MELVRWSGHGGIAFFVQGDQIRGIRDMGISVSSETEETTSGGEKFVKKKNSGGYQITITAELNAMLGVDVKNVALSIAEAARCGESGYFYTSGAKLFTANFMMVDAKISGIVLSTSDKWISCSVQMTLKQCSKYSGDSVSGGGSSSSGSSKSSSSSSKKTTTKAKSVIKKATEKAKTAISTVQQAVSKVTGTTSAAKKQSAAVLKNANTKKKASTASKIKAKTSGRFKTAKK